MFEKVNIAECMVIAGLVIALVMAIFFGSNELSMNIASGLLGYIGSTGMKTIASHKIEEKKEK